MKADLSRKRLYETDYLQWIDLTITALKQGSYGEVDWVNLIDEIEDMARSERKSLKSNLRVLLLHLLKWQYQPDKRSNSWKASVVEHRLRVIEALADSPSLKPYCRDVFEECYQGAVELAVAETGLPEGTFPRVCPYPLDKVLLKGFLPADSD